MIRNRHRIGDYLMVDELSGVTHYASKLVKDWDGSYRTPESCDGMHPLFAMRNFPKEEFPKIVTNTALVGTPDTAPPATIGPTNVKRPASPADFLFGSG